MVWLLLVSTGLTGCINMTRWQTVRGSGNVQTETRQVAGFDRVSVSGAGQLTVVQGEEESLVIEADDNLLPYIKSEVSRGRLQIGPQNVNLKPTEPIRYRLQLKNLHELTLSGSVQADLGSIKTERLAINISGSGRLSMDRLESEVLSTDISGSGSTSAAGQVERQEVSISGSGNLEAADLKSTLASARISGSGHASLWVVESLNARISGSGRVEYRGSPAVESHVSGSGRVRPSGRGM